MTAPVGRSRVTPPRLGPAPPPPPGETPSPTLAADLATGLVPFACAVLVALTIGAVARAFGAPDPGGEYYLPGVGAERGVAVNAALCAFLVLVPGAVYLVRRRRAADPWRAGLLTLVALAAVLCGVYLYWAQFHLFFPGDFLMWSESDFVADVLKLRLGHPLYTADVNNESQVYMPGSQVLTYLLASAAGQGTSIAAFRVVQLVYAGLSAAVALVSCRRLVQLALPHSTLPSRALWPALWLPAAFLIATNTVTNPYVQNLHNDALAQLFSIFAYWVLVEYAATREPRLVAAMVVIPVVGFLVKQNLATWTFLFAGYLVVFDRPRSPKRIATLLLGCFGGIALAVLACYALWGPPFFYWTFTVLRHAIWSPLRTVQHLLDVWLFVAVGLLGGVTLLRGPHLRALLGCWAAWLALMVWQIYTSAVGYELNHIGPASLVAGVWGLAALAVAWDARQLPRLPAPRLEWLRAGITLAAAALVASGLGLVRIPTPPFSPDALRYVHEIEREFAGLPARDVLLDAGSWIYLREGVVMKDRAGAIGDRGYTAIGDFSGIHERIRDRRYAKILVRNYTSPDFWYDHWMWPRSSGIREALNENYREVRRISAVEGKEPGAPAPYLMSDVSVLVPRQQGGGERGASGSAKPGSTGSEPS